jgi:hypothetical protein
VEIHMRPIDEIIRNKRLLIDSRGKDRLSACLVHPLYRIGDVIIVAAWEEIGGTPEAPVIVEHVSVSLRKRCPTWDEMCIVKDIFWGGDELVCQFHPTKSQYVNIHPYCLHMWRKKGWEQEMEW